MAGAFEQTIIIGNCGKDAETRFLQSGVQVTDFSVAVTESWVDKATGEKRERTNWYKVTAWRGLSEVCAKYVKKGMSVMVSGSVQASAYLGSDGQPKASLDLTAREVQFLTRAGDSVPSGANNDSDKHEQQIPF
jgi:single-strand DNA-binding protein